MAKSDVKLGLMLIAQNKFSRYLMQVFGIWIYWITLHYLYFSRDKCVKCASSWEYKTITTLVPILLFNAVVMLVLNDTPLMNNLVNHSSIMGLWFVCIVLASIVNFVALYRYMTATGEHECKECSKDIKYSVLYYYTRIKPIVFVAYVLYLSVFTMVGYASYSKLAKRV